MFMLLLLAFVPMTIAFIVADVATNKKESAWGQLAAGTQILTDEAVSAAKATIDRIVDKAETAARSALPWPMRLLLKILIVVRNALRSLNRN